MASLKIEGGQKVYLSGSLALHNINLETKDKEFLVILGGEASGKSTLLRCVAGLEELTAGKIFIGGKDMSEADPAERDVAFVFRDGAIKPSSNVYDNLAYGLKLRKAPGALIDQRVKAVANILGLNDVLTRMPKTLTAAQRLRVTLGRAVIREPKLYLLDEPLSGLDEKLQGELLSLIINLQARMDGTFVYATKNAAEAMTVGGRIAVIKNGIIQQIDTPANLYDYPANAYVAFLIGSPTINFIHKAKIIKTDEGIIAEANGIKIPLSQKITQRFEKLKEYANSDKHVVIGIRPEDAQTGKEGLQAIISKVENKNGHYAHCDVGGNSLVVAAKEGAGNGNTKIAIDGDRLYLFDSETHLTLLARDGGYKNTGMADSDFVPLTLKEEEELRQKHKPQKQQKKK